MVAAKGIKAGATENIDAEALWHKIKGWEYDWSAGNCGRTAASKEDQT
jgi:hypothetical protein